MYEEETEILEEQNPEVPEEHLETDDQAVGTTAEPEASDDDQGDLSQYKRSTAKRMQQLMKDRRESERARRRIEEERDASRKELAEMRKRIAEIEQEASKAKAESARAAWKKAMEEQDDEAAIAAQEALIESKIRRPVQEEEPAEKPQPQAKEPGPGAESWVAENEGWFSDDPDKLEKAKAIEKELFRDGYKADDDATYIELDARLNDPSYKPAGRKRNPPSNPTQQGGSARGKKPVLDAEQTRRMVAYGLDKDDPKHRKYWLESLREAQA